MLLLLPLFFFCLFFPIPLTYFPPAFPCCLEKSKRALMCIDYSSLSVTNGVGHLWIFSRCGRNNINIAGLEWTLGVARRLDETQSSMSSSRPQ